MKRTQNVHILTELVQKVVNGKSNSKFAVAFIAALRPPYV